MFTQSSSSKFHEYQGIVIFLNVTSMKVSSSHCIHTFRKKLCFPNWLQEQRATWKY
jgi:hypothetical protein